MFIIAALPHSPQTMNFKRFWADLSVPSKFGMCFVAAAVLLMVLLIVL